MGRDLHVHTHLSRVERWRHLIEIAALSIAALWGIYVFVYQEKIKPVTAETRVLRIVTVDHSMVSSGKEFVKVTVEVKNIGESRVQVNAIVANLYGITFLSNEGHQPATPLPGIYKMNFALETSAQKPLYSFFDSWQATGLGKEGNVHIDPGESWTESFAVGIPQRKYDVANVVIEVCTSHDLRDRIFPTRRVTQRDGTYWLEYPKGGDFTCSYQRNGLYYPL